MFEFLLERRPLPTLKVSEYSRKGLRRNILRLKGYKEAPRAYITATVEDEHTIVLEIADESNPKKKLLSNKSYVPDNEHLLNIGDVYVLTYADDSIIEFKKDEYL